jgi:hypothetical protein
MRAIAGAAVIIQSSEIAARLKRMEEQFAERAVAQPPRQLVAAS